MAGTNTCNFYVVEVELARSFAEFRSWRVEVRNVVDYRRRTDRWWRDIELNVWLNEDGVVRGIVTLGPVTPDEFLAVFSRWPTALQAITPSNLREEIYAIVQPPRLAFPALPPRRYQGLKLTIAARRKGTKAASLSKADVVSRYLEPMPILF